LSQGFGLLAVLTGGHVLEVSSAQRKGKQERGNENMKAWKVLLVLGVLMVVPLFAFAAGGAESGKTMDVLFMAGTNDAKVMADNQLVQRTLEKKFNIKLSFSPAEWYNKPDEFKALVAAGNLPDCGWTCLTVKAPDLYNQGVIRAIPISAAEKYAPNYMKLMQDRPLMKAWQQLDDKNFYAFYQVNPVRAGGGFSTALRLDWMENLGIKPKGNVTRLVPEGTVLKEGNEDKDKSANARVFVTDYQYTYDEFVSILEKFVKNDPDGNGQADTYGLSDAILEWMDGYWSFHIFPVDGMNFRWVREADNSAAPQEYSKVFMSFLQMHKALADRGLMTPDYVTAQYDQCWGWWSNGKAGALGVVNGYIAANSIPPLSIIYSNPNAKLLLIPPNKGRTSMASDFMGGSDIAEFFFNKKLTDEKFARLMQMYDWLYATDEGRTLDQYGVKDVNFTVDANGVRTFNKEANDKLPPEQRIVPYTYLTNELTFTAAPLDLQTRAGLLLTYEKKFWPKSEGYYTFFGPGSAATLNAMAFMKPENQEVKDKAYRQYVTDLTSGKVDPDTAFEQMMSVLNGLGYQDYLKAVQTSMYVVADLEKGKSVTPASIIKK